MGILDRVQDNDYIHFSFTPNPDAPTVRRWALRAECRHCKKPGEYKLTAGHSTCSQGFADRAFRARGWLIGPSRAADTCPECVSSAKRRLAEKAEAAKAEEEQKAAEIRDRKILPADPAPPSSPVETAPKPDPKPPRSFPSRQGTGFSGSVISYIAALPIGTECTTRSVCEGVGAKGNSQQTMTTQRIAKAIQAGLLIESRRDGNVRYYKRVDPKVVGHDEPQPFVDPEYTSGAPTLLEDAQANFEAAVKPNVPPPLTDGRVQELVEEADRKFDALLEAVENPALPSEPLRELLDKPEPEWKGPPARVVDDGSLWAAKDRDLQPLLDSVIRLACDIRDMEPPEEQKTLDDYTIDELLDAIALKRMK